MAVHIIQMGLLTNVCWSHQSYTCCYFWDARPNPILDGRWRLCWVAPNLSWRPSPTAWRVLKVLDECRMAWFWKGETGNLFLLKMMKRWEERGIPKHVYLYNMICVYGGFLKWWYPTTISFPTKNDHFGVWNGGTTISGNTHICMHLQQLG